MSLTRDAASDHPQALDPLRRRSSSSSAAPTGLSPCNAANDLETLPRLGPSGDWPEHPLWVQLEAVGPDGRHLRRRDLRARQARETCLPPAPSGDPSGQQDAHSREEGSPPEGRWPGAAPVAPRTEAARLPGRRP